MRQYLHWLSCLKRHKNLHRSRGEWQWFIYRVCVLVFLSCETQDGQLCMSALWGKWQTDLKSVQRTHCPVCVSRLPSGRVSIQCSVDCRQNADKGKFITAFEQGGHAHSWDISSLFLCFCIIQQKCFAHLIVYELTAITGLTQASVDQQEVDMQHKLKIYCHVITLEKLKVI